MKAHLLVFDQSAIDRRTMIRKIDELVEVENWYALFGNMMCIASEHDSRELSRRIREIFPDLRFLIARIDPEDKGGWLPKSVWSFLNDPRSVMAERM